MSIFYTEKTKRELEKTLYYLHFRDPKKIKSVK